MSGGRPILGPTGERAGHGRCARGPPLVAAKPPVGLLEFQQGFEEPRRDRVAETAKANPGWLTAISGLSQRDRYDAFRSLTVAVRLAAINHIRRFGTARVSKRMFIVMKWLRQAN